MSKFLSLAMHRTAIGLLNLSGSAKWAQAVINTSFSFIQGFSDISSKLNGIYEEFKLSVNTKLDKLIGSKDQGYALNKYYLDHYTGVKWIKNPTSNCDYTCPVLFAVNEIDTKFIEQRVSEVLGISNRYVSLKPFSAPEIDGKELARLEVTIVSREQDSFYQTVKLEKKRHIINNIIHTPETSGIQHALASIEVTTRNGLSEQNIADILSTYLPNHSNPITHEETVELWKVIASEKTMLADLLEAEEDEKWRNHEDERRQKPIPAFLARR